MFEGKDIKSAESFFEGKDYAFLKRTVTDAVIEGLRPTRENYERIIADKDYLASVMKDGAERAGYIARRTMSKVFKKLGFVRW